MSQHSKNTDVKQSPLDPDLENEAEQIADMLVSETLDRAAGNINELMQSISRWETEEQESSVACCTNQKVVQELHRFFNLRRVFAEHREQEDLVTEMDAATSYSPSENITGEKPSEDIGVTGEADRTQASSKSDSKKERRTGRYAWFFYKTAKSAGKSVARLLRKKSGNKRYPAPDQHEEEAAESGSESSSPPQEASPLTSVRSSDDIRTATDSDLSTVPLELVDEDNKDEDVTPEVLMEEDLVTDMDATPGTSQVQLGAEHVDEAVGSATSDSPSKDIETKSIDVSPTASTSSSEDTSAPVKADRTQTSSKSDSKKERRTGRYAWSFYKSAKSAGKSVARLLRKKSGNKRHPVPEQDEEEAAESGSESSSPPQDLVTEMDATPRTSQTTPSEMSPTAPSSSSENIRDTAESERIQTSSESDSKYERQTGKKKRTFVNFFRMKNKVQPIPKQHEEEGTPSLLLPQAAPSPVCVLSSEDRKTEVKAFLSPVPLVLVDVDDEDVTPQEKEDVSASEPSTIRPSPPAEHYKKLSSITEEDLVMVRDSTPGPSGQHEHLESFREGGGAAVQLIGLRNIFYDIIKEFFYSLTEEQLWEIKRGVYSMDVKEQMIDMCMEVLRLAIVVITNTLSQAINQFAPQSGTMRSLTSSRECGTEQVGQNLSSKLLRESFDITDNDIQMGVKRSFGEALSSVLSSDSTIAISPKFAKVIVQTVTHELNSILSEKIQASLDIGSSSVSSATCCLFSSCRKCKEMLMGVVTTMKFWLTCQDIEINRKDSDPQTDRERFEAANDSKDPKKNLLWWSCLIRWRKSKKQKAPEEDVEQVVESSDDSRSLSPLATSTSCSDCNEDTMSEESINIPSPYSTGYFPAADFEDKATDSDFQESPPVAETQYSDSSAEKSNCLISCKGKKKKQKMAATTQDDTVRTKKPSLLKRIRMFCRCLCCCSRNDVLE